MYVSLYCIQITEVFTRLITIKTLVRSNQTVISLETYYQLFKSINIILTYCIRLNNSTIKRFGTKLLL